MSTISVIIPVFNKQDCIAATIQSVLLQTFTDFELILVDDGSTDSSVNIILSIQDDRIKLFSKKNGGVSSARNYGMSKAEGDYLFFLDADDLLLNNCFSNFIDVSTNLDNDVILISNFLIEKDGERHVFLNQMNSIFYLNGIKAFSDKVIFPRAGNILIRKTMISEDILFDERISMYEDFCFWIKLLEGSRIYYIGSPLMIYNVDNSELSVNNKPFNKEYAYYIKLIKSKNYYSRKIEYDYLKFVFLGKIKQKKFKEVIHIIRNNIFYIPRFILSSIKIVASGFIRDLTK